MAEEEYTIRPARAEDAQAVTAMWAEMGVEHQQYDPQRWALAADAGERQREHFFRTLADRQSGLVLTATDSTGQVVGYLMAGVTEPPPVFRTKRRGQIWDLFVRPAHRGKGVGRRLMEAAVDGLKARGAEDLLLRVSADNEAAIEFYRKLGLRLVAHEMYTEL